VNYSFLYSIPDENVQDIKIGFASFLLVSPGFCILHYSRGLIDALFNFLFQPGIHALDI
jgi:hypothetical protein